MEEVCSCILQVLDCGLGNVGIVTRSIILSCWNWVVINEEVLLQVTATSGCCSNTLNLVPDLQSSRSSLEKNACVRVVSLWIFLGSITCSMLVLAIFQSRLVVWLVVIFIHMDQSFFFRTLLLSHHKCRYGLPTSRSFSATCHVYIVFFSCLSSPLSPSHGWSM